MSLRDRVQRVLAALLLAAAAGLALAAPAAGRDRDGEEARRERPARSSEQHPQRGPEGAERYTGRAYPYEGGSNASWRAAPAPREARPAPGFGYPQAGAPSPRYGGYGYPSPQGYPSPRSYPSPQGYSGQDYAREPRWSGEPRAPSPQPRRPGRGQYLPEGSVGYRITDLDRYHLRRPPPGYIWIYVGRDIYMVQAATGLVAETIPGGI